MEQDTTIRVKHDTWRRLRDLKEPGVSYDEIIGGLLNETADEETES